MKRYRIKSTFTVAKEFEILANSKEEAEDNVRNLQIMREEQKESTVTRVRINSNEEVN